MLTHSRPWITEDDLGAVQSQLESAMVGAGESTRCFERALGGPVEGVAVASGTGAIQLALLGMGVGPGDEVVVPTYVCRSVAEAVYATGAAVRLCDTGPDWTVNAESVAASLTRRCKVVVVPHLYGLFADVGSILELGVSVVEDRAQAIGHPVSRIAQNSVAVYSFHGTKCMTTGEGGMAVASSQTLQSRLRELRDGAPGSLTDRRVFSPMSDLAAALGLSQLSRYPKMIQRRRAMAKAYDAVLRSYSADVHTSYRDGSPECFRFVFRVRGGVEAAETFFAARAVAVRRGVDELIHRLVGEDDKRYENAIEAFATTVSIPCHAGMSLAEHESCVDTLAEWIAKTRPTLVGHPASAINQV